MNTRPALPLPADPIFALPPSPTIPVQAEEKNRRPRPATGLRPRPLVPTSLDQALQLGRAVVAARLAPRGMETAEACMIAILHGLEVGLSPMQALQRIAVVNGRPTIWGDGALALVQASGLAEEISERIEGDGASTWVAVCEVLRRGSSLPIIRRFSVEDARRARLWGKMGPWSDYPLRMLQMRARAFALRDAFADVLGGLYLREEIEETWEETQPTPPPISPPSAGETVVRDEILIETPEGRGTASEPTIDGSRSGESTAAGATRPAAAKAGASRPRRPHERMKAPPPPADMTTEVAASHAAQSEPALTSADETATGHAAAEVAVGPLSSGDPTKTASASKEEMAAEYGPSTPVAPVQPRIEVAAEVDRRRRGRSHSRPRTAISMRYADHWSIRRPRSMPPEPAYRRRPSRSPAPPSHVPLLRQDEALPAENTLSPGDLLSVYDDALCCALDTATMGEIIEEFADRLDALRDDQRARVDVITQRHATRIAAGNLPRPTDGECDA